MISSTGLRCVDYSYITVDSTQEIKCPNTTCTNGTDEIKCPNTTCTNCTDEMKCLFAVSAISAISMLSIYYRLVITMLSLYYLSYVIAVLCTVTLADTSSWQPIQLKAAHIMFRIDDQFEIFDGFWQFENDPSPETVYS